MKEIKPDFIEKAEKNPRPREYDLEFLMTMAQYGIEVL